MSYQHKKSIVTSIASIIIFTLFNIYWLGKYPELLSSTDTVLWGKTIVIMILVQVIAQILVTILFNIMNQIIFGESEPRVRDELDKLISLRVMRNSYLAFIIIVIFSMVLMMTGQPINIMFNLLYFGLIGSGVFGEITEFIYYRRGIKMAKHNIENNIRRLRFDADEMTQQELADLVGVTRQAIISIEKGKYAPSLELAFKLADAFNVSINEVFSYRKAD